MADLHGGCLAEQYPDLKTKAEGFTTNDTDGGTGKWRGGMKNLCSSAFAFFSFAWIIRGATRDWPA